MKTGNVNKHIHSLLKPLGFRRKGSGNLWNRRVGDFVDILDIQVSQFSSTYTINLGIVDVEVFEVFKGTETLPFIQQPEATIRERIGDLAGGHDKWWKTDDLDAAHETGRYIENYALPFFEGYRSHDAVRSWLISKKVERNSYPPQSLNLAIVENLLGNREEAKEILRSTYAKTRSTAWQKFIEELSIRLNIDL
jgi:Domain of unknown function (DUF4304)